MVKQRRSIPRKKGTKVSAQYPLTLGCGKSRSIRLRLRSDQPVGNPGTAISEQCGAAFETVFMTRLQEADEFYATVIPASFSADETNVMRQALAGMLWSKQFFNYDVGRWLKDRGIQPYKTNQRSNRNNRWGHMVNADIISMPDKWEYPWYAAWDLAFHVTALTLVDADFGKEQLELLLKSRYLHPSGQIPAYEWNFSDVNPPVHAWSTIFTYLLEKSQNGVGDLAWLERSYHKLLLNFTWWVNRKDRSGNNAFEGGFLGLDNIGVFDRSSPLPTGGYLEQADGTAWMALFCQNMLEISAELAMANPAYIDLTKKFFGHFLLIASGMIRPGEEFGMWDEQDGFFYDVLRLPDGRGERLKVRSMVGLLPFCAVTVFDGELTQQYPEIGQSVHAYLRDRPELTAFIHDPLKPGYQERRLASALNEANLRRVLTIMLDEQEFLSPFGIRALSRIHLEHPYIYRAGDQEYRVPYLPGDSNDGMFGGNSNWRGPVWMPVNMLILRALLQYYLYYGNAFTIECPTGSGVQMNLYEVAKEIGRRLTSLFLKDEQGKRPIHGTSDKFQNDPYWKDYPLFYEYFHGDSGTGIGASHQTGWSGTVARIMRLFSAADAQTMLDQGKGNITMKAITVEPKKPGTARYEDFPEPDERDGSVLVEAIAVGVCGTDVEIVEGKYGWAPGQSRLILGHESLGRVIDSGESRRPERAIWWSASSAGPIRFPAPIVRWANGRWCRNGQYTERGIKEIHGFMSERWRTEAEYAIKVDPSLGILGVLLEPMTVITKALEQVLGWWTTQLLGTQERAGDRRRSDWPVGGSAIEYARHFGACPRSC